VRSDNLINFMQILAVLSRTAVVVLKLGWNRVVAPTTPLIRNESLSSRGPRGNHRFDPLRYGKIIHGSASSSSYHPQPQSQLGHIGILDENL
jgi:hypothetical protein